MNVFSVIMAVLSFVSVLLIALFFLAAGITGRLPKFSHPRSFKSSRFLSLMPVRVVCVLFGLMFSVPFVFMLVRLTTDWKPDDTAYINIDGRAFPIRQEDLDGSQGRAFPPTPVN